MVDMLFLADVAELATALDDFEEFEKFDVDSPDAVTTKSFRESKKISMEKAMKKETMHNLIQSLDFIDSDSDEDDVNKNTKDGHKSWNLLRTSSISSGDEINSNRHSMAKERSSESLSSAKEQSS